MTAPAQIRPRRLRHGDTLGIFSPSEPLTVERQQRMAGSLELIERNFEIKYAPNAFSETYYEAGSKEERLADIRTLLEDEQVDALVGSWGGKSANQLLKELPYEQIAHARRAWIGFSDVCVILNAITAATGMVTFCGPNIAGKFHESEHWDLDLICGETVPPFGWASRDKTDFLVSGDAEGVLYGGNLSTFVLGLAGTQWMEAMQDVVFFWESASEPPQILDHSPAASATAGSSSASGR